MDWLSTTTGAVVGISGLFVAWRAQTNQLKGLHQQDSRKALQELRVTKRTTYARFIGTLDSYVLHNYGKSLARASIRIAKDQVEGIVSLSDDDVLSAAMKKSGFAPLESMPTLEALHSAAAEVKFLTDNSDLISAVSATINAALAVDRPTDIHQHYMTASGEIIKLTQIMKRDIAKTEHSTNP
jgi:hypothetical protein